MSVNEMSTMGNGKVLVQELATADKTLSSINLRALFEVDQAEPIETVFNSIENGKDHTVIVLSSLSIAEKTLKSIVGILHYETRALWEILKSKNNTTKVVFVSSIPVDQAAIDHLFSFLPAPEQAKARVKFISLNDEEHGVSLSDKILGNIFHIKKLKTIIDPKKTYINSFLVTNAERKLAEVLGVPLFGSEEKFDYYHTKSGNRSIFQEAGIPFAPGLGDLKSELHLIRAVRSLWKRYPKSKKFMIKLDLGVSGEGNALLRLPCDYDHFKSFVHDNEKDNYIKDLLPQMDFLGIDMTWEKFSESIPNGIVAECFLEGEVKTSPSCQGVIHPNGRIELLSTHEQILNEKGNCYLGSEFPCQKDYRNQIQIYSMRIARALSKKGMIGFFAVDYLVTNHQENTEVWAIEINIRQGGTTHPYQTAKLLTNSTYDDAKGILIDQRDHEVVYRSNDNFVDTRFVGKTPAELLNFLNKRSIIFSPQNNKGVVFHMLGAMDKYGKIGYTIIGNTDEEVKMITAHLHSLLEDFLSL